MHMNLQTTLAASLLGTFCISVIGWSETVPLVSMDFENGLAVEGTTPGLTFDPTAAQLGPTVFTDGHIGKGLKIAETKTILMMRGPIFRTTEGTFSFWTRPPDGWAPAFNNGPAYWRFFLPGSEMLFYRPYIALAVYESAGPQLTQAEDHFIEPGRWRMLTFVYKQGYRALYVDDVMVAENKDARNDFGALSKGSRYSDVLQTYGSAVTYDDVSTWEKPLSPGDVAALFYSRVTEPRGAESLLRVPLSATADTAGPAIEIPLSCNSFSGVRQPADDTVRLAHGSNTLYVRYRMPLPTDYVAEKTRLGGRFFKTDARDRDGDVLADDNLVLELSPDNGTTTYRISVNSAGIVRDEKNGDPSFNAEITAKATETEKEFTLDLTVPLASLGAPADGRWLFNCTRIQRLAGLAKRQAFFTRGSQRSYGTLILAPDAASAGRVTPQWDALAGTMRFTVDMTADSALSLDMKIEPLDHRLTYPDDKDPNYYVAKLPLPKPVSLTATLAPVEGRVHMEKSLTMTEGNIGLCSLTLKTTAGDILYQDSGLVSQEAAGALRLKYIPTERKLYAEVVLPGEALLERKRAAEVRISPATGANVLKSVRIPGFRTLSEEAAFDLADFPAGDYRVEAVILAETQTVTTLSGSMTIQDDPPWKDSRIGIMDKVPAPWTPLLLNSKRDGLLSGVRHWDVAMLGRTYGFDQTLLPSRLVSKDHELLAGLLRLSAEVNGQPCELVTTDVTLRQSDKAGMKVQISGQGTLGPLKADLEGWVEFDGFLCNSLTLSAPDRQPFSISQVVLEIPLRKEAARLYDISGYEPIDIKAGVIPSEGITGSAGSGQFVGTEERGIQWTLAYDPAAIDGQKPTLFITPAANQVLVRLVLANKPLANVTSRSYNFGLEALPNRPFPRTLRNTWLGGLPIYEMPPAIRDPILAAKPPMVSLYTEGWSGKWNYLNLSAKMLETTALNTRSYFERSGTFPALYLNVSVTDGNTPEYCYYQDEWRPIPGTAMNFAPPVKLMKDYEGHDGKVEPAHAQVCATSRSYQDFYAYYLNRVFDAYQSIPNAPPIWVYFDNSNMLSCASPYHGCAAQPPGSLDKVLALREYLKRVYTIVHSHDPRNMVTIHNSGSRDVAAFAFGDLYIEGEQFTAHWSAYMSGHPGTTQNDCYPTVLSLEKARAQFNPHARGPGTIFLSQFWRDDSQQEGEFLKANPGKSPPSMERRFRYITGLMRIHDTPLWGEVVPPVPTYLNMREWGWNDQLEFVPYWDARGAFEFSPGEAENVAVSAWYRPDGKLAMCVFNGRKVAVTVNLTLHPDKFPVQLKAFTGAVDMSSPDPVLEEGKTAGDRFTLKDNTLAIPVRAEDYRLLRFEE